MFTQYIICIEQQLLTKAKDIQTLVLLHYIFNLFYNPKAHDFLLMQEKVVCISEKHAKHKSPVGLAIDAISRIYMDSKLNYLTTKFCAYVTGFAKRGLISAIINI